MPAQKQVTVLSDCFLSIAGTAYEGFTTNVAIGRSVDSEEIRPMGHFAPWRESSDILDWTFSCELIADEEAIGADVFDMLGEKVEIEVRPKKADRSAGNPSYIGKIVVTESTPLEGETGTLQTFSISGQAASLLFRLTDPMEEPTYA